MGTSSIRWRRFGRAWHPVIEDVDALAALLDLEPTRWVATSAPTATVNADPVFLEVLDADADGRIRTEDVKRVIRWTLSLLARREGLARGADALRLDAVTEGPEGGEADRIRRASARVLERVRRAGAEAVTLEEVRRVAAKEVERGLSTAGRVLPAAAESEATRALLEAVIETMGGAPHPRDVPAVSAEKLDAFLAQGREWLAWRERLEGPEAAVLLPLGEATGAAWQLSEDVDPKLDQFFTLCDTLALDARLGDRVWPVDTHKDGRDLTDEAAALSFLESAPVARPVAEGLLDLDGPLNPRFAAALRRTREQVLRPLIGDVPLDVEAWTRARAALKPYEHWRLAEPPGAVSSLGEERLRALLADEAARAEARDLLARSHDSAVVLDDVRLVERLLLCQANLLRFANNFAGLPQLYDPNAHALFERGTLYLDGREFRLAVPVPDRARHTRFAQASNLFVLYVELSDRAGTVLREVAVPVTGGTRGNLLADRWGVFHTIRGQELHARVVQIVENPIGMAEAIAAPFQRAADAIRRRVEQLSEDRTKELEVAAAESAPTSAADLEALAAAPSDTAGAAADPASAAATTAAAPQSQGGLLAGGGIAVAAMSSAAAFVTSTLQGVGWQVIAGGGLTLLAAVLIPTAGLAWLKLRRRDLSAFLEGSGWGINPRMYLTSDQAKTFTRRPDWSRRSLGS
jgi:hypothetical protein